MPNDNRKSLSGYRLAQAEQCLATAKLTLASGDHKAAANRSYYCIFHAMRAVLALDALDSKKHSGIISMFSQQYLRTGRIDKSLSKTIEKAFKIRGQCDYDDFFIISIAEVEEQINNAEQFLSAIKEFLAGLV